MHAAFKLPRQQRIDLLMAAHGALSIKAVTDQSHLEV